MSAQEKEEPKADDPKVAGWKPDAETNPKDPADAQLLTSLSDVHEGNFWKQYTRVFEECLHVTGTHHAPWYVVPADDKENARLIVSRIVLDALSQLNVVYPKTTPKRRRELQSIGKALRK